MEWEGRACSSQNSAMAGQALERRENLPGITLLQAGTISRIHEGKTPQSSCPARAGPGFPRPCHIPGAAAALAPAQSRSLDLMSHSLTRVESLFSTLCCLLQSFRGAKNSSHRQSGQIVLMRAQKTEKQMAQIEPSQRLSPVCEELQDA